MPETINKPKEDTGLENKSTEAGHVGKSPVKGSEHKHENMDFEDEVNIIPPSGGMTLQEMNSYATKKTAIQGLFNATLITKDARLLKGILTEDDIQSGQQVAQLVLVVISLIIEVTGGFLMFYLVRKSINDPTERQMAEKINDALGWLAMLQVLVSIALSVL